MKAIILAAGRGSRMNKETENRPKCLVELMGKSLLEWQVSSLHKGGVDDILVVTGYLGHKIKGNFKTLANPCWNKSNMVTTLLTASKWLEKEPCIISYSDIVYHHNHVKKLTESTHDITITYDTLWKELWKERFADPLSDAETFKEKNGLLLEIGKKTNCFDHIQGQYMGLLHFTPNGWSKVKTLLTNLSQNDIDKLDMTSLLGLLLRRNVTIGTVPVDGAWCEADSMSDITTYEKILIKIQKSEIAWSHDWR